MSVNERNTAILPSVLAFVLTLGLVAVLFSAIILVSGFDLASVYGLLWLGSFGDIASLGDTLIKASPILIISLGLIVVFRAGLWNIGAEGQLYLGALGATLVGVYLELPAGLHTLVALIAAFLMGGAWAALAALLKTRFNANEIITTLLSNFIAFWFVFYVLQFHLRPAGAINPVSRTVAATAALPTLVPGTLMHAGIFIALAFVAVIWFVLNRTSLGYSISALGASQVAASYGGVKVSKVIVVTMFVSGGLAGIAGMGEVLGVHRYLLPGISPNYGYLAIAVALIAKLNPLGAVFASVFFGAILAGGRFLQAVLGVPSPIINVLLGLFVISVLLQPFLERRLSRSRLVRGADGAIAVAWYGLKHALSGLFGRHEHRPRVEGAVAAEPVSHAYAGPEFGDLAGALQRVVDHARSLLRVDVAMLCLSREGYVADSAWVRSGPDDAFPDGSGRARLPCWSRMTTGDRNGVMPGDERTCGGCPIADRRYLKSQLGTVLRVGELVVGTLCVGRGRAGTYTTGEGVMLSQVGAEAAAEIGKTIRSRQNQEAE